MRNLTKSKIFLISCLSFVVGIAIASFSPENIIRHKFICFSSFAFLLIISILFWSIKKTALICLWGAFLFLGIWRYSISLIENYPDKIWYYNGENITFVGVVAKEPDLRLKNQKLEIRVESVMQNEEKPNAETHSNASLLPVTGKILVTADLYPSYNFGDQLSVSCKLKTPEQIEDFAYDRYLARYDIYSLCYRPQIKKIGNGVIFNQPLDWTYKKILALKFRVRELINFGLSDPQSGLALGILIGDRQGLGEEYDQKFADTGLTHIIAVSGSNMTIISTAIMWLFLAIGLTRRQSFWGAVFLILLFTILVGFPASAVRAAIMSVLALFALQIGRMSRVTNLIIFTAAIMIFANPRVLRDDVGFQLSFLAVLGIIYFYPFFEKYLEKIENKIAKLFLAIIILTLSAQILTLPIMAYDFKQISLISPVSNLLVLWAIPLAMLFSFLAIILSFFVTSWSMLFFAPANILLTYIILAVDFCSRFPFSSIEVDNLRVGWVVVYYLILAFFLFRKNNLNKSTNN